MLIRIAGISAVGLVFILFAACVGSEAETFPQTPVPPDGGTGSVVDGGSGPLLPEAASPAGPCGIDEPFTSSYPLTGLNTVGSETRLSLTSNEREVLFTHWDVVNAKLVNPKIFRARRTELGQPFANGIEVSALTTRPGLVVNDPSLTNDGRTLFLTGKEPDVDGGTNIYSTTRNTPEDEFAAPTVVGSLHHVDSDLSPFLTRDGEEAFFVSTRAGGVFKLFHAVRSADGFGPTTAVEEINRDFADSAPLVSPTLSADGLTLYFGAQLAGSARFEVWYAKRLARNAPFTSGVRKAEGVNVARSQQPSWLSDDQCRLYVARDNEDGNNLDYFVFERFPL